MKERQIHVTHQQTLRLGSTSEGPCSLLSSSHPLWHVGMGQLSLWGQSGRICQGLQTFTPLPSLPPGAFLTQKCSCFLGVCVLSCFQLKSIKLSKELSAPIIEESHFLL